jgi:Creatinine amidohydrolase/Pyridine nucleotide-disulphide oxidoreductase
MPGCRACVSCNQECVGRVGLNRWLGCVQNPRAGRESVPIPIPVTGPLARAARGRRVYVAGGGPGGLQAAVTAAGRGHHVTLFERAGRTGGQVSVAARAPSRAEFGAIASHLAAQAARLGVDVRTGHAVSAGFLLEEAPDAVVLATGARPARPSWYRGGRRVADVREVIDGTVTPSGTVCRSATRTFSRVLLVSTHGGNATVVRRAGRRLRGESREVLAWMPNWRGDAHAGRTETSLLLALDPDHVRLDRAEAGNCRPIAELMPVLRASAVSAVSANGVLGDPAGASAAEGAELLGELLADLLGTVRSWRGQSRRLPAP